MRSPSPTGSLRLNDGEAAFRSVTYTLAFVLACGIVAGVGFAAANAAQRAVYNEQLLDASLKASAWGINIENKFAILKTLSESAAVTVLAMTQRMPVENGTLQERQVFLNQTLWNDIGDRVWANNPGLFAMIAYPDYVLTNAYPPTSAYNEFIGKDYRLDTYHEPYLREMYVDRKTRAVFAPTSTVGPPAFACVSPVVTRDDNNPDAPPQFWGFVAVIAQLPYLVLNPSAVTRGGYVADLDVFYSNETVVLATSRDANTTDLHTDPEMEVVQEVHMEAAGTWRLRVRPLDGWKGGLLLRDICIVVVAAFVAGAAAVFATHEYLQWRFKESTMKSAIVRTDAHLEFAGYIYHEIRNPTHALVATLDLAPPELKAMDEFRVLRSATTMIHRLLDSALDLLKLESGQVVLERTPVAIIELVEECVSMSRPRLLRDFMKMDIDVGHSVPPYVYCDPLRLQQVVMNLLSNAAKHCRTQVVAKLRVETHSSGTALLSISVEDDGNGIPKEQQGKLFQRFAQAKASTTRTHGGTGLGLCITKGFVDLMGGELLVHSEMRIGTTFKMIAPFEVCPDVPTLESSTDADTLIEHEDERLPLHELRILFVDDNDINRNIGTRAVRMWTSEDPALAADGADALRQFKQAGEGGRPFDVVFMDLTMPVMDGWVATEHIRNLQRTYPDVFGTTWIAALSGSCIYSDIEKAHRCGIDEFLTKPCSIHMMRKAMCRAWHAKVDATMQGFAQVNPLGRESSPASRPRIAQPE